MIYRPYYYSSGQARWNQREVGRWETRITAEAANLKNHWKG